jgi:hemolysin III
LHFPEYSTAEKWLDNLIHLVGVGLSLTGAGILLAYVIPGGNPLHIAAASVYSLGLLAMFACSAAYHMITTPWLKEWLRRFDHAAIYLMIAGSYTPFALVGMKASATGIWLLVMVWLPALLGVLLKLCWPRRLERVALVLYVVLGWIGLIVIGPLFNALSSLTLIMILIGGVLYTAGVAFHLRTSLSFHNAIWHTFVLMASGVHYVAVMDTLLQV